MNLSTDNPYTMLVTYLLAINLLAFMMFFTDKAKARKAKWRISEKSLLMVSLLGGSLGAFIGMKFFRHKTKHKLFTIGLPLILLVQVIVLLMYLTNSLK